MIHEGLYSCTLAHGRPRYVEATLKKYSSRPISLADACLIRCAEVWQEPRILTFDSDFKVYRRARNKKFQILGVAGSVSIDLDALLK